jgi:hypothetical protein
LPAACQSTWSVSRSLSVARTRCGRPVKIGQPVRTPCSTQRADQPRGVTWTTIRRRQALQNRGGSSAALAVHAGW